MSVVVANICLGAGTINVGADVGATVGAITITPEREMLMVQPEQFAGDIMGLVLKEGYVVSFEHLEPTLTNLNQTWFLQDAAGSTPLNFGGDDTPAVHTDFSVYGTCPGGFRRTIAFHRVIAVEPGDYLISRREAHKIGAKYRALLDTTKAAGSMFGTITDAAS